MGVFDEELARLSEAMFKLMYDTDGVGLAAPQVGVNYRMMVYNEAGEPGKGKEVTLVNPSSSSPSRKISSRRCLSFPKIYAEVEVRRPKTTPERFTPRPRAFLFPPPDGTKPVSAYNKYTLINGARRRVPKTMSKPHARLPPVQMTPGIAIAGNVSPDPTPQTLNLLLDPLSLSATDGRADPRRRTCGEEFKMTLDGFEARVFQHEYDHLDGVLFHDRMTPEVLGTIQKDLDALVENHPEGEPKGL